MSIHPMRRDEWLATRIYNRMTVSDVGRWDDAPPTVRTFYRRLAWVVCDIYELDPKERLGEETPR